MTSVHAAVPSENWDDDFEFQQRTSTSQNPLFGPRVSIASSDWDQDDNLRAPTNTILEDKKNTFAPLAGWAEPGPSTPKKVLQKPTTENWDDDFEDSPIRRAFPSPPQPGSATRSRRAPIPRTENWDDDFESPPRNPNIRSLQTRLISAESYSSSEDEGDDHIGGNAHDIYDPERDEEDKTVTARSRQAALARLTNKTPPPPVPALPLRIDTNHSDHPHPFPRSPTSSVFTVPRPPSAFTVNSTTHLRPTVSRTSSSNGPASLSPSPPVNRETRERRRLRKKSRPPGVGPIEMDTFSPIIPERDGYESEGIDRDPDPRPQTPPPQPTNIPTTPGSGGGGTTTLLSRINSVKKWGVRRKRGSTTPSETLQDNNAHGTPEADQDQTPRRHSQASSASIPSVGSSVPDESRQPTAPKAKRTSAGNPGPSSSWFFRSGASTHSNETGLSSRNSNVDLKQSRKVSGSSRLPEPSPTKLVKRKSLGFVPLRMGFGGNSAALDDGREKDGKRRVSAQRPVSPSPLTGNGSLRRTSESSDSIREVDETTDKDGSRGFMGSVRRLSLTNKHKRTKSGVSLASVTEIEAVFGSPPRDNTITPKPSSRQLPPSKDVLPPLPLLPPIELSPPSPPRHKPKAASGSGQLRLPVSPSESMLATAASSGALSAIPSANNSAEVSPITPAARSMKKAGSPQAASLGRSTIGPSTIHGSSIATRRSSLGDLKIPDRISQAQVSLRRDLGMVREFAANVEQLKELQITYNDLVAQVEQILDRHAQANAQQPPAAEPRSSSPSFLANLTRPKLRKRSNTASSPPRDDSQEAGPSSAPPTGTSAPISQEAYKHLASVFYTINSKYRISWECAELLIELGGGSASAAPSSSVSAPAIGTDSRKSSGNRERAITLSGEEPKPPTPAPGGSEPSTLKAASPNVTSPQSATWRATGGKPDLNHRQLTLLRDMLNNVDTFAEHIPEESSPPTAMSNPNREWRWGDAMSSTITLPSEESSLGESVNKKKKRRAGRLGMTALRDMLRMLKKNQSENSMADASSSIPTSASSLSINTSQQDTHLYPHGQPASIQGRRRAKTDTANDERERVGRSISPVPRPPSLKTKRSPRRPSLAAIFRIGQKSKTPTPPLPSALANSSKPNLAEAATSPRSNSRSTSRSSTGDEDWDQIDSSSDLDSNAKSIGDGTATVRVKGSKQRSPYLQDYNPPPGHRGLVPKRSASGSQSSIWGERGETTGTTPPNTRGTRLSNVNEDVASSPMAIKQQRPTSARLASYGSKAAKTGSVRSMPPQPALPDPKLAMTPENIKPLLENTKEVHVRLSECIVEIRNLLQTYSEP